MEHPVVPLRDRQGAIAVLSAMTVLVAMVMLSGGLARQLASQGVTSAARARGEITAVPLYFEANRGQSSAEAKFIAHSGTYNLFLTGDSAVISLWGPVPARSAAGALAQSRQAAVRIRLAGANRGAVIEGVHRLPGRVNYLIGSDPGKWERNVPIYGRVRYRDVYPGVDLIFYGSPRALEYDLVAAPGADASKIAFAIEGGDGLAVDKDGGLRIQTGAGTLTVRRPAVYQKSPDGRRESVPASFVLAPEHKVIDGVRYQRAALELADYDRSRALIIDPQIVYSSYLGGSGNSHGPLNLEQFASVFPSVAGLSVADAGLDIAVDSTNKAYITGVAFSSNFPTVSAFQASNNGANSPPNQNPNLFVAKFDTSKAGAASVIYSTYVGGSGDTTPADAGHGNGDLGFGIAVDGAGDAYVAGQTYSTNFPGTSSCGAFGRTNNQGSPSVNVGLVTELNPAGNGLIYSCYIDGSSNATEARVALMPACQSNCAAYLAGSTQSTAANGFPVTPHAFQSDLNSSNGKSNATLVVVNGGGGSLQYATYYGGAGNGTNGDSGLAVTVDSTGRAYLTGATFSTNLVTVNPEQSSNMAAPLGLSNAFVAEFNPALSGSASLLYATYLGGSGAHGAVGAAGDVGTAIALDSANRIWLAGATASTNFPITSASAFQSTNTPAVNHGPAATAAFITELNPALTGAAQLLYSTYLSGEGNVFASGLLPTGDAATGIAVSGNDVVVTGLTTSPMHFPVSTSACQKVNNGNATTAFANAFVTELNPTLTPAASQLVFSTYLGGSGEGALGAGLSLGSTGHIFVTGATYSTDFVTVNAAQAANNAAANKSSNAFITELDPTSSACPGATASATATATGVPTPTAIPTGVALHVTVTLLGDLTATRGQTVSAGTFAYLTSTAETVSSVTLGITDPSLFSSVTLTPTFGGSAGTPVTITAPNIGQTAVFTFHTPLAVPAATVISFALSGTIAGGTVAALPPGRVQMAGLLGNSEWNGREGLAVVLGALTLLGLMLMSLGHVARRRGIVFALLILTASAGLVSCGGGSSGGPLPQTTQLVSTIQATSGTSPVSLTGLPVTLGTIKVK